MPLTAWITLFGIVIAAVVALIIAYLQRKQMRQIELHRADPTVPLVPPPHSVTQFLRTNFWYLYSLAFMLWVLYVLKRDLSQSTPVTRTTVLYICVDVGAIILMIVFVMMVAINSAFKTSFRSHEIASDILKRVTKSIEELVAIVVKLKERDNEPPKAKQK